MEGMLHVLLPLHNLLEKEGPKTAQEILFVQVISEWDWI